MLAGDSCRPKRFSSRSLSPVGQRIEQAGLSEQTNDGVSKPFDRRRCHEQAVHAIVDGFTECTNVGCDDGPAIRERQGHYAALARFPLGQNHGADRSEQLGQILVWNETLAPIE